MDIARETEEKQLTDWNCLRNQVLDARFEVGNLLQPDRNGAWFHARDLVEPADVLLFLEEETQPGASQHFDRFREATFLKHPNLVRVLAAGRAVCDRRGFVYLATETAESDLAEELQHRPMTVDEAVDLTRQLAAGLAYLHSENLTSCAVRAGAIWRVNSQWKLGDYSQLRVPGRYPTPEIRPLMLMPAFECPPEANDGLVTPAWDVWSVGSLLRKVFPRSGRAQTVPPPFDSIVRGALDPDPDARPSLDAMLEELTAPLPQRVGEPPAVVESPSGNEEPEATAYERPLHQYAESPKPARGTRTPIIAGVVLATAIAIVLAFVLPVRMVHPESVRVSAPASSAPAPVVDTQQPPQTQSQQPLPPSPFGESTSAVPGPQVEKEISAVLDRWAQAKRRRNADEEVDCYAPSVDRFYGQRSLPASQLRREEQNVFSRIGAVQQFEIGNVTFNRVNPEWAVVSFDKKWNFEGRSRFAGSSREEMVLRPVHGHWKISSEREVKVYWVSKQATGLHRTM